MALANEVAKEVRETLGLTLAQVAVFTGYSKSHIQAIENGDRVASADFLAGLFKHTGDIRLPQLIDPYYFSLKAQFIRIQRPQPTEPVGDLLTLVGDEIESNKRHASLLQYVYRIARDGRLDANDHAVVADYLKFNAELIDRLGRSAAALTAMSQQEGSNDHYRP